jgi:uncharacterized repeat protein (TIGR03803 family)
MLPIIPIISDSEYSEGTVGSTCTKMQSLKICVNDLFFAALATAGLGLMLPDQSAAQTFTNLHSFDGSGGANPSGPLVLSGGTLYGTALAGGSFGVGTLFKLNTDGTGFTNLHSFTATSGPMSTNSDGSNPIGGLVLSGDTLYGTASHGGSSGYGTVFKIKTDGTEFTTLHSFDYLTYQLSGLLLSGSTLYGTSDLGGGSGTGSIFALNTDGTGFTILHNFSALCSCFPTTNSEGAYPLAPLIVSERSLYGTAAGGGMSAYGTVFKLNVDGTGFTNLHNFSSGDGYDPNAGLILSDGVLYGAALTGGNSNNGTIFSLNTDGTDFRALHHFTGGSDGGYPGAAPLVLGNKLYGTTTWVGNGTVFEANTDGTDFTTLYHFTQTSEPYGNGTNSDGSGPRWILISENTLYGTAYKGGAYGGGTLFSVFILPRLAIAPVGANVILTWPTNATGFALQSATNLVSPVVWTTVSPGPVIVNGQNTVTNPMSVRQQFYRLSQ